MVSTLLDSLGRILFPIHSEMDDQTDDQTGIIDDILPLVRPQTPEKKVTEKPGLGSNRFNYKPQPYNPQSDDSFKDHQTSSQFVTRSGKIESEDSSKNISENISSKQRGIPDLPSPTPSGIPQNGTINHGHPPQSAPPSFNGLSSSSGDNRGQRSQADKMAPLRDTVRPLSASLNRKASKAAAVKMMDDLVGPEIKNFASFSKSETTDVSLVYTSDTDESLNSNFNATKTKYKKGPSSQRNIKCSEASSTQKTSKDPDENDQELCYLKSIYHLKVEELERIKNKFKRWIDELEIDHEVELQKKDEVIQQLKGQLKEVKRRGQTELNLQDGMSRVKDEQERRHMTDEHGEILQKLIEIRNKKYIDPGSRGRASSIHKSLLALKIENAKTSEDEFIETEDMTLEEVEEKLIETDWEKVAIMAELHKNELVELKRTAGLDLMETHKRLLNAENKIESLKKSHNREVQDLKRMMLEQETKYNKTYLELRRRYDHKIETLSTTQH